MIRWWSTALDARPESRGELPSPMRTSVSEVGAVSGLGRRDAQCNRDPPPTWSRRSSPPTSRAPRCTRFASTSARSLVIDELGYLPTDQASANWIFQVVTHRYDKGSIVLTSNSNREPCG